MTHISHFDSHASTEQPQDGLQRRSKLNSDSGCALCTPTRLHGYLKTLHLLKIKFVAGSFVCHCPIGNPSARCGPASRSFCNCRVAHERSTRLLGQLSRISHEPTQGRRRIRQDDSHGYVKWLVRRCARSAPRCEQSSERSCHEFAEQVQPGERTRTGHESRSHESDQHDALN